MWRGLRVRQGAATGRSCPAPGCHELPFPEVALPVGWRRNGAACGPRTVRVCARNVSQNVSIYKLLESNSTVNSRRPRESRDLRCPRPARVRYFTHRVSHGHLEPLVLDVLDVRVLHEHGAVEREYGEVAGKAAPHLLRLERHEHLGAGQQLDRREAALPQQRPPHALHAHLRPHRCVVVRPAMGLHWVEPLHPLACIPAAVGPEHEVSAALLVLHLAPRLTRGPARHEEPPGVRVSARHEEPPVGGVVPQRGLVREVSLARAVSGLAHRRVVGRPVGVPHRAAVEDLDPHGRVRVHARRVALVALIRRLRPRPT
eukprot:scaffold122537_cov57-Phaeocystis_antarctica.AAC.1